ALLVKVTARIWEGKAFPVARMWAMRVVSTRVFPVPAPARTSTGPSVVSTASRCSGLSPFRYGGVAAWPARAAMARAAMPEGADCGPRTGSSKKGMSSGEADIVLECSDSRPKDQKRVLFVPLHLRDAGDCPRNVFKWPRM